MVISYWAQLDIPNAIGVIGVLIILASGTVAGMRLHRWCFYRTTWGRRLPGDTGAWIGLAAAILLLLNPLQLVGALFEQPNLVDYRSHPTIKCLLADEPPVSLPGELTCLGP